MLAHSVSSQVIGRFETAPTLYRYSRAKRRAILRMARRWTYSEIARQRGAGAAEGGLVAALMYDTFSALRRLLRRRRQRAAEERRAAKHEWRAERKSQQREARMPRPSGRENSRRGRGR